MESSLKLIHKRKYRKNPQKNIKNKMSSSKDAEQELENNINEDFPNQEKEGISEDEPESSSESDIEPYDFKSLPEYACKFKTHKIF